MKAPKCPFCGKPAERCFLCKPAVGWTCPECNWHIPKWPDPTSEKPKPSKLGSWAN